MWAPRASVDVTVKEGVVQLHGTIFDERERDALRVVAENVLGVRRVEDHVVCVEPTTRTVISSPHEAGEDRPAA
jgi:hypothetical protein